MSNQDIQNRANKVLVGNYRQAPFAMVRGEGCALWDADGKQYLDMFGGIATCALGHCAPAAVEALDAQARRLWHVTNGYYIEPQVQLAERLTRASKLDRAFFCNSGGEANEAALKVARKYFDERGQPERFETICARNSFHGRTLATTAATGQEKYHKGYDPLPEGFTHVPYGDVQAIEGAITARTAAVMLEPIQGEGGVIVPPPGYLTAVRALCDRHGLLFIADEVQTGMGRTGRWYGHQHEPVRPDVLTMAKALGNGMPIGAMLCTEEVARAFAPGSHGSTFGGNPLATAVAVAVFDEIERKDLVKRCAEAGEVLRSLLQDELAGVRDQVIEVRGRGLLVGVEVRPEAAKVVARARTAGVLFNAGAERVVRIAPALIITDEQLRIASRALAQAIAAERV